MAKEKVIVRRLEAIENLGNMDILCSDKTGRLTPGSVTLQAYLDASGGSSAQVLRWGSINSTLETGKRNMLDEGFAISSASRECASGYRFGTYVELATRGLHQ